MKFLGSNILVLPKIDSFCDHYKNNRFVRTGVLPRRQWQESELATEIAAR
jgi:hypothetical protein